ncbi:MAG: hypothetical protein AAFR21_12080 [Pseudomonadota bacterium]
MSKYNHSSPDLETILENNPDWLDEALDTLAVSKLTGIPACTLNTWRCRGGGPRFMKFGRSVRYRRRTVLKWMRAHEAPDTDEVGPAHDA